MTTPTGQRDPPTPPPPPTAPTPATQWRRQARDGELYTLPSGNAARLRQPGLTAMIMRAGKAPNPLSDAAVRLLAEGSPDRDALALREDGKAQDVWRRHFGAICEITRLVFVEPRIADDWECAEEDCDATWSGAGTKCPRCGKGKSRAHEPDYEGGEIALTDVPDPDMFFAWMLTQQTAAQLATFRVDGDAVDAGRTREAV